MSTAHFWRGRSLGLAGLLATMSATTAFADPSRANATPAAQVAEPGDSDMPTGDGLSKWKINDEDPMKSLPTDKQRDGDPLQFGYHLMDLAEKAGVAAKKGDHRSAVKYFAAIAKAVPDRSVGFTKLCASYEALGEWDRAVEACRAALGLEGVTAFDSAHFVRLLLSKRSALTPSEIEDASAVVDHLRGAESTNRLATDLQCEIGTRLEDAKRLTECTTELAAVAPDDPRTISYQWALALAQKDFAAARAVIAHARETQVPAEGIQHMEDATSRAEPLWRKSLRDWRLPVAASVVVAAAIAIAFARKRSMMAARS